MIHEWFTQRGLERLEDKGHGKTLKCNISTLTIQAEKLPDDNQNKGSIIRQLRALKERSQPAGDMDFSVAVQKGFGKGKSKPSGKKRSGQDLAAPIRPSQRPKQEPSASSHG